MVTKKSNENPVQQTTGSEPETTEEYIERGWGHYSRKEFYRAESDFRKALELAPNDIDALYPLAMTLEASERPQEAVKTYEQILELLPALEEKDMVRAHMLTRLVKGHINRIQTGDWNLRG